jgi:hypothetical protein
MDANTSNPPAADQANVSIQRSSPETRIAAAVIRTQAITPASSDPIDTIQPATGP